jgi:hypothetical protein
MCRNIRSSAMTIRSTILDQVAAIARQHDKPLAPLTDELLLAYSGLDSLCIAILVANLEDMLELDPFASSNDVTFPVTLGELIRLYENAQV